MQITEVYDNSGNLIKVIAAQTPYDEGFDVPIDEYLANLDAYKHTPDNVPQEPKWYEIWKWWGGHQ